jgi:hypothetical protein
MHGKLELGLLKTSLIFGEVFFVANRLAVNLKSLSSWLWWFYISSSNLFKFDSAMLRIVSKNGQFESILGFLMKVTRHVFSIN